MITTTDLFGRFQERLVAAGGQAHAAPDLTQAAEIIATHPALANGEVVVAPHFAERQPWSAILPLLTSKGLTIREAASPASVADAPAGLSIAELAVAEKGGARPAPLYLTGDGSQPYSRH